MEYLNIHRLISFLTTSIKRETNVKILTGFWRIREVDQIVGALIYLDNQLYGKDSCAVQFKKKSGDKILHF